jgi:hypothetical protein
LPTSGSDWGLQQILTANASRSESIDGSSIIHTRPKSRFPAKTETLTDKPYEKQAATSTLIAEFMLQIPANNYRELKRGKRVMYFLPAIFFSGFPCSEITEENGGIRGNRQVQKTGKKN